MKPSNLSNRTILLFWYPLLLTWLMMAIEGPYLAAIIARLPQEKYNLAAFGVSFSFALVIEAPVIMLMSASIALIKGNSSFRRLRFFTIVLNTAITVLNLVLLIPPVFTWITIQLIGLEQQVADLVYQSSIFLLPWAPAIGYRRFYQGLLIKAHQTRKVTFGTIFRLVAMSAVAWLSAKFSTLSGAAIGGVSLSTGVVFEALATRILVAKTRKKIIATEEPGEIPPYSNIISFYTPLALTSIIGLSVRPAIVFFMGQSKMAIETLAVLPVINALLFIFAAIGLSFQEVGVTLMGEHMEHRMKLQSFAIGIASTVCFLFGLIAFTPLSGVWFQTVSGLSNELTAFAIPPTKFLILMPWFSVYLSFQRALMVNLRTTRHISRASAIEVLGIISVLVLTIHGMDLVGAIAASLAITGGRLLSTAFLQWKS